MVHASTQGAWLSSEATCPCFITDGCTEEQAAILDEHVLGAEGEAWLTGTQEPAAFFDEHVVGAEGGGWLTGTQEPAG